MASGAVIGPNAVLQHAAVIRRHGGEARLAGVMAAAGLKDLPTGEAMIPEGEAAALHRALRAAPDAEALEREAGTATADYILAHRIPVAAQRLLKALPAALPPRSSPGPSKAMPGLLPAQDISPATGPGPSRCATIPWCAAKPHPGRSASGMPPSSSGSTACWSRPTAAAGRRPAPRRAHPNAASKSAAPADRVSPSRRPPQHDGGEVARQPADGMALGAIPFWRPVHHAEDRKGEGLGRDVLGVRPAATRSATMPSQTSS